MSKPLIGVSAFSVEVPCARSAVNQQYIDAVFAAGGAPVLVPVGLDHEALDRIYDSIEGLLLPGGGDVDPEWYGESPHPLLGDLDGPRDDLEIYLARKAILDDLPVLGICRGIQVMAVAAGGTLYQDLPTERPSATRHEVREYGRDHLAHDVQLAPGSHLAAILGCTTAQVNSFHHQAVRDLPDGFRVSGSSKDGVVEAIEAPGATFAVGVQCHPEELWCTTAPEFTRLFKAFVEAAADRTQGLRSTA